MGGAEVKIGSVSGLMKDNDAEHQIEQIEHYLAACGGCDLLCFGESFLQGFGGLSWQYREDLGRAMDLRARPLTRIRKLAQKHERSISFGFIERDQNVIHSSNLVIGPRGETLDLFRRVSPGWKERGVGPQYREGSGFHTFAYGGKTWATAICGDVWHDPFLGELEQMRMDVLLWPAYMDYDPEEWEKSILSEYAQRTASIKCPVLLINSFVDVPGRAKGGCYVFSRGEISAGLPMGRQGVLEWQF